MKESRGVRVLLYGSHTMQLLLSKARMLKLPDSRAVVRIADLHIDSLLANERLDADGMMSLMTAVTCESGRGSRHEPEGRDRTCERRAWGVREVECIL